MRVHPVRRSLHWGYAQSNIIYIEGPPGQMNFTLTVRWVRRILYWGYARSDIYIFFLYFWGFFYIVLWHHTGYALLYKDLSVYPHRCVAQQRVPPGCRAKIQTLNLPCGRLVRYQLSYATPPTELCHIPNRATPHPYWATPHPWLSYATPLLSYATPLDIECALGQANFTLKVRPNWHNLYWGYAQSDEFYIEGTPGQTNFTLRVRRVRQILHWGYAKFQRSRKSPKTMSGYFRWTKFWKKIIDSYRGNLS